MKQQKTFIVLRDKKTGYFLSDYKNRTGRLAYEASWVECVNDALIIPEDYLIKEENIYKGMARIFEAELIRVKAEFLIETLDGKEPNKPVQNVDDINKEKFLHSLLEGFLGGE
ncbi:hypothetical protein [Streptococcus anginosus]|uniref:hypothetical protein n=1 Tax=Streptococcus anginosus TaxID=1328 RepID=UPI0035649BDE